LHGSYDAVRTGLMSLSEPGPEDVVVLLLFLVEICTHGLGLVLRTSYKASLPTYQQNEMP
jgi:hypothetical protein